MTDQHGLFPDLPDMQAPTSPAKAQQPKKPHAIAITLSNQAGLDLIRQHALQPGGTHQIEITIPASQTEEEQHMPLPPRYRMTLEAAGALINQPGILRVGLPKK